MNSAAKSRSVGRDSCCMCQLLLIGQAVSQSISQSVSQSVNQSINQSISQSVSQSAPCIVRLSPFGVHSATCQQLNLSAATRVAHRSTQFLR